MENSQLQKGFTLWFTGLPCSGKTTISQAVARELRNRGIKLEVLDGDVVRQNLSKELGFSREDRRTNCLRNGFVAKLLTRNDVVTLAALISPYRKTRQELMERVPNFHLVFVDCPVEVCADRDVKGMYAKAKRGEIPNFTGISDPYQEPENPDLHIKSSEETIKESTGRVLNYLEENNLIPSVRTGSEEVVSGYEKEEAKKVQERLESLGYL